MTEDFPVRLTVQGSPLPCCLGIHAPEAWNAVAGRLFGVPMSEGISP
jgi:hypothetical protein